MIFSYQLFFSYKTCCTWNLTSNAKFPQITMFSILIRSLQKETINDRA